MAFYPSKPQRKTPSIFLREDNGTYGKKQNPKNLKKALMTLLIKSRNLSSSNSREGELDVSKFTVTSNKNRKSVSNESEWFWNIFWRPWWLGAITARFTKYDSKYISFW